MKKLSTIYEELGIAFRFPLEIKDANGKTTYFENSKGDWGKYENDANGNVTYFENSDGYRRGTPRSAKTCKGKVAEIDGIKYKLKAL